MKVLVAIGGHSFDRNAFEALLACLPNTTYEIVKQPEAARRMNPADMRDFDALLLYDLPGIDFRTREGDLRMLEPPKEFTEGFAALIAQGVGIVALHHALAGWPAWPRYSEILGGAFLYGRGLVRGRECADSGFAPDIEYTARVVAPDHPIAAGLPVSFLLRDELYLGQVFEAESTTVVRAQARFNYQGFQSAAAAVKGLKAGELSWQHDEGSDAIAWARHSGNSRIVYIQPGDAPQTLRNPNYQRLVANGLAWVARRV